MLPIVELLPAVTLLRVEENYEHGTFGILLINVQVFCLTLEPRDEENKQNISSIPAQQYICERVVSPKYGDVFEVKDVPDRFHVLFHALNFDDQTEACIGLGTQYGQIGNRKCILNSKEAFKSFMAVMKNVNKFTLTIKEVY